MLLTEIVSAKDGLIAAAGAVVGGVMLKLVDRAFQVRDKTAENAAKESTDIRKELREEIHSLRGELKEVSLQLDAWKEKYFAVLEDNAIMKGQLEDLRAKLDELSAKQEEIQEENRRLMAENHELLERVAAKPSVRELIQAIESGELLLHEQPGEPSQS